TSPRVTVMNVGEVGSYLLLLMYQWQSNGVGLPSDREALRKLARAKRGTNLDAVLEHFESDGNGHLFNRKLHEQWKDSVRFYSGKADAGREGGIASGIARSKAKAELEANTKQSLST